MKIILINSGNDAGISGNVNAQAYPPLGIISLGTAIETRYSDQVQIVLIDGQVDSVDEIAARIQSERPDLVGISIYCTSIRNSLRLVQEAKSVGARTILGNDHAAFHHQLLLERIPEIDFICVGDVGEQCITALVGYSLGLVDFYSIPDLAFRSSEGIAYTPANPSRAGLEILSDIPIPNRNLLPKRYWEHYLNAFRRQTHRTFDVTRVTGVATINRGRGCARSKSRCRYCGIADLTPRGSSGKVFWKDARAAREQVAATHLYEAFDSATSWPKLLQGWLAERPPDLEDTRLKMYAQAAETNKEIVKLFADLGVFCVNSGFDSGDTKTLQIIKGRNDSEEQNRRAADLWTDAGIEIHTSFVLTGLGNEKDTREALDRTLLFAEWLADSTLLVSLDSALMYPDKSAPVGSWIWYPERAEAEAAQFGWEFIDMSLLRQISKKWKNEIFLDPIELCKDFALICGVDPNVLFSYDEEIKKISEKYDLNYGRSQGGPLNERTET